MRLRLAKYTKVKYHLILFFRIIESKALENITEGVLWNIANYDKH